MRHMRISKSKFVAGCQCLKRLYWQVHSPELAAEPDAASEAIIQQGHEVGMVARQLFPGGVEVRSDGGLAEAIKVTRELVANPDVQAIFEGVFEHQDVLVKVDILQRRKGDLWRLVEVKSASDLKDSHVEDVAIQSYVLSGSGMKLSSVWLAHINREYVLTGTTVDPRHLFSFRNLTQRAQNFQPELKLRLRSQFQVLAMPEAPDVPTGLHCVNPVVCEFFNRCNRPRPNDHIGFLPRIHASAMEELEEMGIESIRDVPDDFDLTEIQRRAATCVQRGEPWFDRDGLKAELAKLEYPLFFMDFESVNPCLPRFAGMRAYDQLCFQYSLHLLREPGAEPEHYEFLATDASDPRREFISSLLAILGDSGSIVVYSSFESKRLSDLATWLPEYAERIGAIQSRLFDLLPVVREHVYHSAFAGSYSIKSVLPALVPEMTYDGMEVANGQDAGLAWESLARCNGNQEEHERFRKALLAYCGQDTLALVKILERLRLEAGRSPVA